MDINQFNKSSYLEFFETRNDFGSEKDDLNSSDAASRSEKTDYLSLVESIKKEIIKTYTVEQLEEYYESVKGEYEGVGPKPVKRPLNAFMIWSKLQRNYVKQEHKNLHHSEVSRILGSIWRTMAAETKEIYKTVADKLQAFMLSKNPNYKYRPVRKVGKKKVTNNLLTGENFNEMIMKSRIDRFTKSYNDWSNWLLLKCLMYSDLNLNNDLNLSVLNPNLSDKK